MQSQIGVSDMLAASCCEQRWCWAAIQSAAEVACQLECIEGADKLVYW